MLRGLKALFMSGLFWDPMVLLGIFTGSLLYFNFEYEQIESVYFDARFYALAAIIGVLYNFSFRPVYRRGGRGIDYQYTTVNAILAFLKLVISSVLVMSFISLVTIF